MNPVLRNFIFSLSLVISILFIVFQYYQIDRFIILNTPSFNIKKEIEHYSSLPRHTLPNSVTIGIIADKPITHLYPTIKSLFDQTVKINKIYIIDTNQFIPHQHPLRQYINVVDWNSTTHHPIDTLKLLEKDNHTKIILLQNNIVYGTDFLEHMINSEHPIKHNNTECYSLNTSQHLQQCTPTHIPSNNYQI